ncbi:hypothetical protein L195_g064449, partial [Trifolium pratense]
MYPLPAPNPPFEIGENPNPNSNPVSTRVFRVKA